MAKEVTLADAHAQFLNLMEGLVEGSDPVVVTENGKAKVVMINVYDYQILINAVRMLQELNSGF